jgi:two-component system CheB/CheR fusion protein
MPKKKTDDGPEKHPKNSDEKASSQALLSKDGTETGFHLPIVAIGASAGGLEAFEQFFTNMPPNSGMAFVLVQHLDPTHKSILTELVRRYTAMTVLQVEDGMAVAPDTVFVIPPNRYLAILHGNLHLLEPTELPGLRTPIDYFFRSLAEDQKEKAICIVLSGTGTEGALGLRTVKGEGGMGMVQDPDSAKYDGMPRNAIATGLADYILPPAKMPEQLILYVHHALTKSPGKADVHVPTDKDLLEKIFILVRSQTGHDFSYYKQNTILRRIDRRMAINQITRLSDYVRYLQEVPREADILFKELLIGVTSFFRDKEAFEALRDKAIPKLVENRSQDDPIRIWVPGCATGEEAYTIAILCRDVIESLKQTSTVQIFATDIDNEAIEAARQGLYPDSISVDVAPEFLQRYFTKEDSSRRVRKEIRDMVVFALQNVITDPPFSKIDLISCRNLLIYLGSVLQKKVLPLFHYSLKKEGFLFLGSSETIGEFSDYFSIVDRKWKLFKRRRTGLAGALILDLHAPTATDRRVEAQVTEYVAPMRRTNYREVAEKIILECYGPSGAIINEKNEVLYFHGRVGKYLEPASGEFTGNILAMAREGLKLELATSIRRAGTERAGIRTEHVLVKTNGEDQLINLIVKPISEPASLKGTLMVIFEDVPSEKKAQSQAKQPNGVAAEPHPRVRLLEQELRSTREYLQTTIEELETSNEELKSTNEELQSSNEELQSTNEELETSKEELQSVNEELTTVNSEHQQKIEELSKISSDLNNLLASTEIGTIFLDTNLNIQRFTPAATGFVNLLSTDIGRPVSHLSSNMLYDSLAEDAREVLKTLKLREVEIASKDHRWYTMRILPYRTVENMIDGVVVTFMDITLRKRMEEAVKESEAKYRTLFHQSADSVVLVEAATWKLQEFNARAYEDLGYSCQEFEHCTVHDFFVMESPEDVRKHIERIVKDGSASLETKHRRKDGTLRDVLVNSRAITMGGEDFILSVWRDITDRKKAQESSQRAMDERERRMEECSDNLRRSELLLRRVYDALQEAVLVVSSDLVVEEMNPAAERMFGYSKKEIIGRSTEILHVDHEAYMTFGEKIGQAVVRGETLEFDFEAKRKTGEVFPTSHTVSLLKDDAGEPIGIVNVVRVTS